MYSVREARINISKMMCVALLLTMLMASFGSDCDTANQFCVAASEVGSKSYRIDAPTASDSSDRFKHQRKQSPNKSTSHNNSTTDAAVSSRATSRASNSLSAEAAPFSPSALIANVDAAHAPVKESNAQYAATFDEWFLSQIHFVESLSKQANKHTYELIGSIRYPFKFHNETPKNQQLFTIATNNINQARIYLTSIANAIHEYSQHIWQLRHCLEMARHGFDIQQADASYCSQLLHKHNQLQNDLHKMEQRQVQYKSLLIFHTNWIEERSQQLNDLQTLRGRRQVVEAARKRRHLFHLQSSMNATTRGNVDAASASSSRSTSQSSRRSRRRRGFVEGNI
jgi:DNA polymerase III alpha subunit (gram-positive type)